MKLKDFTELANKMNKNLLVIILIIFCCCSQYLSAQQFPYSFMQQGFQNPPVSAQPLVYSWWLGGYIDTIRLKEEIASMKSAGIGGFTIFEIGARDTQMVHSGPAFLSDESLESIKIAVKEAAKFGLDVGLNTASSWNAGGNWIPAKHTAKSIYYSKTELRGETTSNIKLPFPEIPKYDPRGKPRFIEFRNDGKPVFYEEISVLAIPAIIGTNPLDTGKIINVSKYFNSETEVLNWKAPPGNWEICRYVCSNSGENLVLPSKHSAGPIVDHFDAAATEFHFTYIINKLESVLGKLNNSALKSLYMASYEARGFTWTTTLPHVFKRINGYDIDKFLPVLFIDSSFSPEITANFKADFQKTLSELMINNFYRKSKEVCNKHGLKNNSEAGGPGLPLHNVPVEPIKALGALDIPRGEFWINHSRFNEKGIDISRVVKEVSSASHIYDRGIVEMEAFTTFQHWQEGPFEMKPYGDRAFCEGMNKVVVHGSTHNPSGTGFPGIAYHAGTHYNDKRVWWPKIKPFNEYLSRISFILQEADFVADVLFYYGDTIPNYGGHKNSRFTAGPGYDYEIINTEILKDLTVKDGKLVLPGTGAQFSILVLTEEFEINPQVLIKLSELVSQGAIIIGPKPKRVAARRVQPDMNDVEKLIDKLWTGFNEKDFRTKSTKIYNQVEPSKILEYLNVVPDFNYIDNSFNTLDYIHYAKNELDFYLIRNTTEERISRNCSFRQQNKIPEIWDPVSGKIIPVSIYNQDNKYINIPISFAPYESIFIVFKEGNPDPHFTQVKGNSQHPPHLQYIKEGICFWEEGIFEMVNDDRSEALNNNTDIRPLEGAWEVYFPKGWGAPEKVIFPKLQSWTESENDGVKYFSGIARYEKSFVYNINSNSFENPKFYLDLGDLSHVGEVWLNDRPLGITWTKPYRFDITSAIKAGPNKLVIEIANTWSNRIVGDALTGKNYTNTNITSTIVPNGFFIRAPWAEVPLIESGLFGPVTITTINPVN